MKVNFTSYKSILINTLDYLLVYGSTPILLGHLVHPLGPGVHELFQVVNFKRVHTLRLLLCHGGTYIT